MTSRKGAIRRAAGFCAVLMTLAVGTAACGGDGGSSDGTFVAGHPEPDHLIPSNTTSSYSWDVTDELFENLLGLDKNGDLVEQAAQSVESADQKVWTIRLRPGQKFHNGEPVTAQSFADAWNYAAYGPNGFQGNDYFSQIQGYADLNPEDDGAEPKADRLSGVKVVDDLTLQVTLDAPFSQFKLLLTHPAYAPLPKAAFTDIKAFENKPIGNGPYMMDGSWERNRQIKLKAFPGYTGPRKPRNKGVIWKSYASADTAYTDLRAGRIDVMQSIPAAKVSEARRILGDRVLPRQTGTFDYLGFPVFDKRFADPDLRRAISMAIDRNGINKAVFDGTYTVADSLLPPLIKGHRKGACGELCTYDPAKAPGRWSCTSPTPSPATSSGCRSSPTSSSRTSASRTSSSARSRCRTTCRCCAPARRRARTGRTGRPTTPARRTTWSRSSTPPRTAWAGPARSSTT